MEVETEAFEKDLTNRFTQAELRQRRIAQQDIQAALRGQLADLMSHVESGVETLIRKEVSRQLETHEHTQQQVRELVSSNNARIEKERADFTRGIEDTVAGIVLKLLKEYWVLDSECRVLDSNQRPIKQ
jgi:hypothetical protein